MTLISRRDVSKILLAGSTGLMIGAKNGFAAVPDQKAADAKPPNQGAKTARKTAARSSTPSPAVATSKRQDNSSELPWSDVLLTDGEEKIISYRTGWVVYEESLTKGQFVGRGWNGAGYVNFYDGRLKPQDYPVPEAFLLEIDGQLLATDWQWVGLEKMPDKDGN